MKAKLKSKLNLDGRVQLEDVIPLTTPFLLYVDPSSACNFKCNFCPTGHKDLLRESDYGRSVMPMDLFEKLIDDLGAFDQPLRVMRMNKIGEPTLNKNLAQMISLAKTRGGVESIDLATNVSLLTLEKFLALVEAGLDRMNISLEGMSAEQYLQVAKVSIDFDAMVEKIAGFYENRAGCEVTIKIPGNLLDADQRERFLEIFGNFCDRIFMEDLAPIWPLFDVEDRAGFTLSQTEGQYKQELIHKDVCTYIFYSMAVNADGTVSACCPDWDQKLIVGDLRKQSLEEIWNSAAMNSLRVDHLAGNRSSNPICRDCGHLQYAQVDNIDPYRERVLERVRESLGNGESSEASVSHA